MKCKLGTLALLSIIFCYSLALAATPAPPGLFRTATSNESVQLPDNATPGQSRLVRVNRGQLRSGRLFLNLGIAPTMAAELRRLVDHGNDSLAWVGRVNSDPNSTVIFTAVGDSIAGSIRTSGRLFKLEPAGKGLHVLAEVPPGDPYPEMDPIPVTADGDLSDTMPPGDILIAGDDGTIIDVLALYTPASLNRYKLSGVEALIQLAITETNQSYLNSGVNPRVRLAHMAGVDYTESSGMGTDLIRLRSMTDGYMDEIHALRNQYSADAVSLIVERSDYCGIAYMMTTLSTGFESSAFSVVDSDCATGYYSFGHELGHNQGSHHDHNNASGALYDYSYGWQDPILFPAPDMPRRTVMAYNCTSFSCTRVQHFSNPKVNFIGTTRPTGEADYADNARSLNDTAYTVSNWRESASLLPPEAPTGLSATAEGTDRIMITWTDNAANEDGFRLERSEDGANFAEIVQLTSDTVAYIDNGLSAETTYYYRAYAYNAAGVSPYSNTTKSTTEAPVAYVEQFATGEIAGTGTIASDYTDTWEADGNSEIVTEIHSGGKPSKRHALLEHTWTFNVQAAGSMVLFAQIVTDATGGEAFTFAYSTDGQTYVDMFAVTSNTAQNFALPAGISGAVYVRVTDTQHTSGLVSNYYIGVDQLLIRSETAAGNPPTAPTNALAQALSSSEIAISWIDNADDEYGFEVRRSNDGGTNWDLATSLPANTDTFTDNGLAPNTGYQYRVSAFNGAGHSEYSNTASATTGLGTAIDLSATSGKTKGNVYVDLTWSGATTAVDIYRDDVSIASNEINDGFYHDILGRVKGTFVYEVCETGTSICSNPLSITP